MLERTSTSERYARGIAAAIVAVATLVLAANAGPARAAEPVHSDSGRVSHVAESNQPTTVK